MADEKQLVVNLALKAGTMKQQINSINKDIKQLKTDFKNAGSGIENFEKTSEGLSEKLKLQQSVLEKLKDKLNVYKQEQEKCTQTLDKAVSAYQKQEQKVKSLEKALEEAKSTYGENSEEVKSLEEQLTKANKALETKRNSVINADNSLKNMNTTISSTEAEIKGMERQINQTSNTLDELENGTSEASDDVNKLGDSFKETEKDAVAFGAQMTIIGEGVKKLGEGVVNVGKKIVGAMGELVEAGSEYSAEVASTDFLLKNLDTTTQEVINSSSELANTIGLTNKQYRDSATAIATYYKNMGYTTEETNNLTSETMTLVADLAAITDMPFDDALSRFKSGLMGNYEALDAFGINISANTLQNSEFIKSLGQSWNSIYDNTKMTAVYKEILRQSSSATGLATQEAAEFGMQNKLLAQRINELKGSIGEKLLPTLEPFLAKINEIVGIISNWVEKNPELAATITTIATGIGAVLVVFGTLITTIGTVVIMWGAISTAIVSASIPFLAIAGVITGVIAVIALLAGGVASNFENIKIAIENLKIKFSESFGNMQETFNSTWFMLQEIYNTVVQPLFDMVGQLIEATVNFIADCMPGISTVFKLVFDIVKTVWDTVGKPVADFIMDIFKKVVDWFVANLPFLSQVFNQVMTLLSNVWNTVGKPLFDFIKSHINYVITFLTPIINLLGTLFVGAFNTIKLAWNVLYPVFEILIAIISKVASVAINGMTKFQNAITTAMGYVLTPINWVINKLSELFSWLGSVGEKAGGVLSKLNPFSWFSLDDTIGTVGVGVDTSGISTFGLDNIALSGSYYTPQTRDSVNANNIISKVNGASQTVMLDRMMNTINNALVEMSKTIQELKVNNDREVVLYATNNSYLDSKLIANETTKQVIKTINRSTTNYKKGKGGLALG